MAVFQQSVCETAFGVKAHKPRGINLLARSYSAHRRRNQRAQRAATAAGIKRNGVSK